MNVSFKGNELSFDGKQVLMEARIRKVNKFKDLSLVRLAYEDYAEGDPNAERNIIALDLDGNVRWRIQRAPSAPTFKGKRAFNPYVGIDPQPRRKGRVMEAYDGTGLCWLVDPETGKVSNPIVTK